MSSIAYFQGDGGGMPYEMAVHKTELPDINLPLRQREKDEKWIKAFKWYNEYTHTSNGQKYLHMNCAGCYIKVYQQLKLSKEKHKNYKWK